MKCPKCSAPVNPQDKFCRSCGQQFVVRENQIPGNVPAPPQEKKKMPSSAAGQHQGKTSTLQSQTPKSQLPQKKMGQPSSAAPERRGPVSEGVAEGNGAKNKGPVQAVKQTAAQVNPPSPQNAPKTQVARSDVSAADIRKEVRKSDSPALSGGSSGPPDTSQKTIGLEVAELKPGAIFAKRYRIKNEIGRGGMGFVFLADDLKLKEPVALKLLLPGLQTNQQVIQRFIQEIKLSLKVTHENVIRIYDIVEMGEVHFISMEYVEGIDLKKLIRSQGKLPLDYGIGIIQQICHGLNAAHKKGITHRDVKPQNILIGKDNIVKIVDFGIAKVEASDGMTREGVVIGTPEYMSPEQALAKKIDFRTDIYSVGVIMFEIFTGVLPFQADTPLGIALKHVNDLPPSPRKLNPEMPQFLDQIILKAMEKDTGKRYQSMEEVIVDLDRLKSGDTTGIPAPASPVDWQSMELDDLFQLGMDLFNQRQFHEALQRFEVVLKRDPNHPKAYDYLEIAGSQIAKEASVRRLLAEGEQAFKNNDYQIAHDLFSEADELLPDNPEIQIALRKVKSILTAVPGGSSSRGAERLPSAAATKSDQFSDFEKGKELYDQKKYDEAIECFNSALSRDPNHTQSYEYLELAKAAKSAHQEIEHHFLTAKRLHEENDIPAAINELNITLDYDPNHEQARQLLEELEALSPRRKPAEGDGELELEQDSMSPELEQKTPAKVDVPGRDPEFVTMLDEAKKLARDNQLQEAIDILKRALDQFPEYHETTQFIQKLEENLAKNELKDMFDAAKKLFQQKKFRQAARFFTQLIEKDPANSEFRQWSDKTNQELREERKKLEDTRSIPAPQKDATTRAPEPEKRSEMASPSPLTKYLPIIGIGAAAFVIIAIVLGIYVIYPSLQAKHIQDLKSEAKRFYAQGQYSNAADTFQQLYDLEPQNETLEYLAKSHYFGGSYLKAQELFQKLITSDNPKLDYYHFMGMIHDKKNDYQKAIENYQKIIELDPRNNDAYKSIGTIYFNQKLFDNAINYLTICLEIKPQQADVRLLIAESLLAIDQIDEAEAAFKNTLQLDPRKLEAYLQLVQIYLAKDRTDEAIATLKNVLSWNTSQAEVYCQLGTIYEKKAKGMEGQLADEMKQLAMDNLQQCVKLDPKNKGAMTALARLFSSKGDQKKAISLYKAFLADFPKDADVHFELGALYHRQKNNNIAAFEHYMTARDLNPNDPRIWANLGTLYYETGSMVDARKSLERSLELDPNQPRVKKFYDQIKRLIK